MLKDGKDTRDFTSKEIENESTNSFQYEDAGECLTVDPPPAIKPPPPPPPPPPPKKI